jgi:hypothetical protein
MAVALLAVLLVQVPPPNPIARLEVSPGNAVTMPAGDTLRLRARALGADGRPVPGATVNFFATNARFEAVVDQDGLVRSGSTGTVSVSVSAFVPGGRPITEVVQVRMIPGPAARIEVERAAVTLVVGQRFRPEATAYSASSDRRDGAPTWTSSASEVATVRAGGFVTAMAPGSARLTARDGTAEAAVEVRVVADTVATVELTPDLPAARQGDVLRFTATARDAQGRVLEGLTPAWSMAPGQGMITSDGAFVGYQPGRYTVSATFGARGAETLVTLAPRDVRRPATVVGRLPRTRFTTEEVWIHPNGVNAYLGSGSGGDVLYVLDISDPANPRVTDSLVADTRRVNDVMTTPDGTILVHTREGSSSRRDGIVIASLEDPAHPRVIAEFTDGVTGGVHSAFIFQQPRYGTHVYLTHNATGEFHIVDITDPARPREAARWSSRTNQVGNYVHDVDVKDGLAYLSYWNDGLVILDVGNGIKGGSPSSPQFVSQYKYDLNALYRGVEASGGPGFIRGTHTAWRHNQYVFIADEVFPGSQVRGAKDAAAGRAYGRLQVIDVSEIEKPRSVAYYEPEFGGVHNVWAAGDTLYIGGYNAGFRAFDIAGELMGDLRAQGREMVHVNTADMDGFVRNTAMTWGVVVRDGLAYVNDMYNGLWIIRMEPRRRELSP